MLSNEFGVPFDEITVDQWVRLAAGVGEAGPTAQVVRMHTDQFGVIEVHPEHGSPYRTPFHVSRVRELVEPPPAVTVDLVADPLGQAA